MQITQGMGGWIYMGGWSCILLNQSFMQLKHNKMNKNTRLIRLKKEVSMARKYQNHTLQTNPRHREEEPHNIYCNNTSLRQ